MPLRKPKLTIKQILKWAEHHHKHTGRWPAVQSGPVRAAPEVSWTAIESALQQGCRGFPGGDSLGKVMARYGRVRKGPLLPRLTIKRILAWADAHHRRTGCWPNHTTATIPSAPQEHWRRISAALHRGLRGLPGGSSLAKLLADKRNARYGRYAPRLTTKQVLAWADAHHKRTKRWPNKTTGRVISTPTETWGAIHVALREGLRGLPGGVTLALLLVQKRNIISQSHKPKLAIKQILLWADRHHRRTGQWPKQSSGAVRATRAESWSAISQSLMNGTRGLPGGSSIAKLLYAKRGVISQPFQRKLTLARIRAWARAHHHRTGKWPTANAGDIVDLPGENWRKVDNALRLGLRGQPGGNSLPKVLPKSRRSSRRRVAQPLTIQHLLRWADDHHRRTGRQPTSRSGRVRNAPSEDWGRLDTALRQGFRGFAGDSSLANLLTRHRGIAAGRRPRLTVKRILAWADEYRDHNERWPILRSGGIPDVSDMNWRKIDNALRLGFGGLPGGSSLSRVLDQHRGVRNKKGAPALTLRNILEWADAHHRRTGTWPSANSGPVREAPAETWSAINGALIQGTRGMAGGSSLARFLAKRRSARNRKDLPKLTFKQILSWADRHFERTGRWPTSQSGRVVGAFGETWSGIDKALRRGSRQLRSQSSLPKLLKKHGRDFTR